ncbi:MAG: triose-phosphate isomerase [Candidatus Kerfeldbacteria bacterium]|nr:triose-phosphate isomerase [Candidatus Kerfeldbacteria bacterium]
MPRRPVSTPLIVANWKMQLGVAESAERALDLKTRLSGAKGRFQVVVCPSFLSMAGVKKALRGSTMKLGAQDVFWDERGAYTGEVSPVNLREIGAEYVIIGHSERRQLLGETDSMVGRKVISALGHGLTPILCVGETAHERNEGRHELVVARQIISALKTAPPPMGNGRLYIAYEPIWAIGTGEPASPEQALAMHDLIRQTLIELYSLAQVERSFRTLYGGSVTADNVNQYIGPKAYHGALVGTASLQPESFVTVIKHIDQGFTTKHL